MSVFGPWRLAICILITILLASPECAWPGSGQSAPDPAVAAGLTAPAGRLDRSIVPGRYQLELRVDPRQERFSGQAVIDVMINGPADGVWLHGKNLDVTEVYLTDGQANRIEASYEQYLESGVARVGFGRRLEPGAAKLHFVYSAPFNTSVNALFKVLRDGQSYAVTQFESTGARQAFPCFDEPGFKVPFDLAVQARAEDVVIASTPETSIQNMGNGYVRHVFATTRPLPTYLLAMAVGPYDVVDFGPIPANSIRRRQIPLRGIAAQGMGGRLDYALRNTSGLLSALEEYFGSPYPYEKLDLIAVPESFGGAMENPGAITYDEYLLLMDEDSPLSQRRSYTATHAHEMAHMWFGDLVTPAWWNDIWLNEAFASWMMYKVSDAFWPQGEFDRETLKDSLAAMAEDSLASAREIRQAIDYNDQIDGAFDGITYQKGAGVLAMLERYVGKPGFQAGIRLHMKRHADGTATAEDFIDSLAQASGHTEIGSAFKSYIEQPGVPLVSAHVDCADEHNPVLEVSQSRYAPLGSAIEPHASQWHIPMCIRYTAEGSRKDICIMLNESKQSIRLDAHSCPGEMHLNADGAGYYRFTMDETWWDGLLAGASNLTPAEALVLADSLDAAFRTGAVTARTYVNGMAALVNHPAWDVAEAAIDHLEQIVDIVDTGQLGPVEQGLRDIVRPRFARLAGASDTGSKLLHKRMQRFLVVVARDQAMRQPLARQAGAIIGLNGAPDPSAASPDELETILGVGVQDLSEPFFDLLLAQAMPAQDPAFRSAAFGALARVEDPAMVGKLQEVLMSRAFKGTELVRILSRQMHRAATTEQTYAWLKNHIEEVIDMFPEFHRAHAVAALGGAFCSSERAAEWQKLVVSQAGKLPGYERPLAQAIEQVRLCAALKQARANELITAFSSYGH